VVSQKGPKIILGPEYADEVKSHPACNADVFIAKEFHAHVSGFEVLRPQQVMKDAIRLKLTRSIGKSQLSVGVNLAYVVGRSRGADETDVG
jgi:hypothetical protein